MPKPPAVKKVKQSNIRVTFCTVGAIMLARANPARVGVAVGKGVKVAGMDVALAAGVTVMTM
jgi:hypothetical protein